MKKKIVSLTTGGVTFNLGQIIAEGVGADEVEGRKVNHIEMKRDGMYGITRGANEETNYAITLMNPVTDKDVVTMIVPYNKFDRLVMVEVEEDKDKPSEIADVMTKVD